jgi:hypothetical protein
MTPRLRTVEIAIKKYADNGKALPPNLLYGKFHGWGNQGLEGDNGSVASETIGIVELSDGQISTYYPYQLRFIKWSNK